MRAQPVHHPYTGCAPKRWLTGRAVVKVKSGLIWGFRRCRCEKAGQKPGLRFCDLLFRFASAEDAAGDDLRLDLSRTFEDVEDAGVAEDAGDFVLQREAVAAVDLQTIVGSRPGDACAE